MDKRLLVIQQRSAVVKGCHNDFAKQIFDLAKWLRVAKVVVLTSVPSLEKQVLQ